MIRILARSRALPSALLVIAALCALSYVIDRRVIVIDVGSRDFLPETRLPLVELWAIGGACIAAILMRPRLWDFDRVATGRARLVAAMACVVALLLPQLCVASLAIKLPDIPASWVASNILVLSSTLLLLAPLMTPVLAGVVTLALWFGVGVIDNLYPASHDLLPLVHADIDHDRWALGVIVAVAAVAAHAWTRGATVWSHRLFDKDS